MVSYECYYIRPVLPAVEKNRGYVRAFDDGGGASIHVIPFASLLAFASLS